MDFADTDFTSLFTDFCQSTRFQTPAITEIQNTHSEALHQAAVEPVLITTSI